MPPVHEVTRAFRSAERSSPKTVLGFLAIMVTVLATTTVFAAWFCADKSSLHYLVPIVFGVFVLLFMAIVIAVLVIAWKDVTKLMLGQITGRDYALIQRLTLGDSNAGEHVDSVIVEIGKLVRAEPQNDNSLGPSEDDDK